MLLAVDFLIYNYCPFHLHLKHLAQAFISRLQGYATGSHSTDRKNCIVQIKQKMCCDIVMNYVIVMLFYPMYLICCVVVDKLRFEPPLKKETEASSEMVST